MQGCSPARVGDGTNDRHTRGSRSEPDHVQDGGFDQTNHIGAGAAFIPSAKAKDEGSSSIGCADPGVQMGAAEGSVARADEEGGEGRRGRAQGAGRVEQQPWGSLGCVCVGVWTESVSQSVSQLVTKEPS